MGCVCGESWQGRDELRPTQRCSEISAGQAFKEKGVKFVPMS